MNAGADSASAERSAAEQIDAIIGKPGDWRGSETFVCMPGMD